jgi:hypothetical protein
LGPGPAISEIVTFSAGDDRRRPAHAAIVSVAAPFYKTGRRFVRLAQAFFPDD